jgi:TnpA family transposase
VVGDAGGRRLHHRGLLKNTSEIQPSTIHADTQGQSLPVFSLAHLLGFELMPRIRNWKELNFYRPSKGTAYVHTSDHGHVMPKPRG